MKEEKHATSVAIQDSGIMILGSSGSGKSDLALRLIDAGATLISDDLTVCKKVRNDIFLYCKKNICGKIEVRGMGIFTVPFIEEIKLKLVVKMTEEIGERFPSKVNTHKILGKYFPRIDISKNDISANAKINLKIFELRNE
ncbi:HPr kinase/phosphatase C-terminal domain-containing protein [Alphaproteobacteria bacterium]|nr:HPr kinase/phosphatase C-terminal domain-containing protein [Alphaproteobacteria bacterium]